MTASGCAANGQELHRFFAVSELGRVRHEVGDGRAALRARHAADGRDAIRDAQLDRPAGPGHRRLRRERPRLAGSRSGARVLVSIAGSSAEEFGDVAERLREQPGLRRVVGVEVNISCPNVANRGLVFACDPLSSARSSRSCASGCPRDIPIFAKLTPDVTDIVAIAAACVKAGADGLTMINTLLGMVIDTDLLRPQLGGRHRRALRSGRATGRRAGASGRCTAAMREGRLPVGADHRGRGSAHRPRRARARRRRGQRRAGRHRHLQRPDAPRCGSLDELRGPRSAGTGFDRFRRRRRRRPRRRTARTVTTPHPVRRAAAAAMDAHGPFCAGIDPHRGAARAVGAARTTSPGWSASR